MVRYWQPTPSGRQRLSVLGALNAITHQLITVTTDAYIHRQHVAFMLYKLVALDLTVPITVVLDNARYQRCAFVQEIAAHLHIELLFLPTYSPQFNLIERFWKLVKKHCLHAQYHPTYPDLKKTLLNFIVRSKVKTTAFRRSDLSLKPFARVGKRDGLSIR